MRNLLFLVFILTTGCLAQAQDSQTDLKAGPLKVDVTTRPILNLVQQTAPLDKKASAVAGIFVLKHSRIKRALSFKVKSTSPKLA